MSPIRSARRATVAAGALLLLPALPTGAALAQEPVRAAPCTYDSCALRVEDTWLSRRLVVGPEGRTVARLGLGGPSLANIVQRSDSAVVHARRYERAQTTGAVLTLVGTIGSLASFIAAAPRDASADRDVLVAVNIGSLVVGLVGQGFQIRARRELARSLWWYNRAVVE